MAATKLCAPGDGYSVKGKIEGMMKRTARVLQLTAVIEREDDGYVATCPELDIVSEGDTVEIARLHLLEAVEGFFEVASPSEIQRRLKKETYVMPIMPTVPTTPFKQRAKVQSA